MAWERQHFNFTNHILAPNKNTEMEAGGTVEHTLLGLPCHYQASACCCPVETVEPNEKNKS